MRPRVFPFCDVETSDIVGSSIFDANTSEFSFDRGPIFANIVLADEINRATPKTQSALLEAMQERTVTLGETTFNLDDPFLVLATQNPIEQEGTYPLPEAQIDRFMLKLVVGYPSKEEELELVRRMSGGATPEPEPVVEPEAILRASATVEKVYIDPKVEQYPKHRVHLIQDAPPRRLHRPPHPRPRPPREPRTAGQGLRGSTAPRSLRQPTRGEIRF